VAKDVYRAAKLPAPIESPPSELVYVATSHDKGGAYFAWMQLFVLPIAVGIATAVYSGIPWLALVVMAGAFVLVRLFRKRTLSGQGAVLRVEEGELRVFLRGSKTPIARIPLRDLADVRLDVKTIQRVQEGDSMIAAVRFTDTTVGPSIDQARIVLVGRKTKKNPERLKVHLTEDHFAHMDATEWLGKIRVFLRKNGWVPVDERKKEKAKEKEPNGQ
jgi:hypothetical protein